MLTEKEMYRWSNEKTMNEKETIREIFEELEKNREINFIKHIVIDQEKFDEIKKKYLGDL